MTETGVACSVEIPDCPVNVKVVGSPFPQKQLASWRSWLRADERQRVAAYRKRTDQELFIARRALARQGIAQQLNVEASSIHFSMEPTGKLRWAVDDVANQSNASYRQLDFSISKTTGLVAMAVCESALVGVDIETIGALPELEILAKQNLHPIELQIWNTLPSLDRTVAYYQLWVVKEAFAKAIGVGLAQQPNSILSTQALMGQAHGTVELVDDETNACSGSYWMTSIGDNHRLAVVTAANLPLSFLQLPIVVPLA